MQYISEYQEDIMDLLSREKTGKVERPVRVLQFGEGNFLRAFVDYMIDIANEQGRFNGGIVLVKADRVRKPGSFPRAGMSVYRTAARNCRWRTEAH